MSQDPDDRRPKILGPPDHARARENVRVIMQGFAAENERQARLDLLRPKS